MSRRPGAGWDPGAWRMPAEWDPHERTWMAWPSQGYTLGDTEADVETARRTWAAVALMVAEFEPVTLVVDPADVEVARSFVGQTADVTVVEAPLDDAWMRDIGPSFVLGARGELGAVDWTFNGWGAQSWAHWAKDAADFRVHYDAMQQTEQMMDDLLDRPLGIGRLRLGTQQWARSHFGIFGLPVTLVVDRHGQIRQRLIGPQTGAQFEAAIRPYL